MDQFATNKHYGLPTGLYYNTKSVENSPSVTEHVEPPDGPEGSDVECPETGTPVSDHEGPETQTPETQTPETANPETANPETDHANGTEDDQKTTTESHRAEDRALRRSLSGTPSPQKSNYDKRAIGIYKHCLIVDLSQFSATVCAMLLSICSILTIMISVLMNHFIRLLRSLHST